MPNQNEENVAPEGTRYLVIEIPPEATEVQAQVITEAIFNYASALGYTFPGDWDLFAYVQHSGIYYVRPKEGETSDGPQVP